MAGGYLLVRTQGHGVALGSSSLDGNGQLAANYFVGNLDVMCRIVRIIFFQVFNRQLECGRRSVRSLFGLKCECVQLSRRPGRRFTRLCVQINRPNPAICIRYIFICSIVKGIGDLFHIFVCFLIEVDLKSCAIDDRVLIQAHSQRHGLTGGDGGLICAHSDGRFVCCKDGRYQTQHHRQCQQNRNDFFHVFSIPPIKIFSQQGIP